MHFQIAPHPEAKLVRCIRGAIVDIIVDMRPDSPTRLQHVAVELTADNRRALYVPPYFAHGYQTLVDDTEVMYQVSGSYEPAAERGLRYDDPALGLDVAAAGVGDQRQGRLLAADRRPGRARLRLAARDGRGPRMIIVDTALQRREAEGPPDPGGHGRRRLHGPRAGQPDRQLHARHDAWRRS